MNKEIQSIIADLKTSLSGEPWYGKPVYKLLDEASHLDVYKHPSRECHSLIELLYHMITWGEFTLACLKKAQKHEIETIEALDWRGIEPEKHTWQKAVHEFKSVNASIIELLQLKEDDFLDEDAEFRKYNVRFLLSGLIQHHIYHAGQIAYIKKLSE